MRWVVCLPLLLPLASVAQACTFGGLASYPVASCNPAANEQSASGITPSSVPGVPDDCDQLNSDDSSCNPWQCDPATSRCVPRTRDDDRDGDPPAACGGGDCDDHDARLNSLRVSLPTPLAALPLGSETSVSFASNGGDSPVIAATTKQGTVTCLSLAAADAAEASISGCTALTSGETSGSTPTSVLPAQPYGLVTQSSPLTLAATFVSTFGCPKGAAGVVFNAGTSAELSAVGACSGAGANLPALALTAQTQAALAYYQVGIFGVEPLSACAAAVASPLVVTAVPVGQPSIGVGSVLTPSAISIRPPALLAQPLAAPQVVFVASPDAAAASIWALDPSSLTPQASMTLSALAGARSVAMSGHANANGGVRLAIVAELGCAPEAIHLALVDYTPGASPPAFAVVGDVEVSPAGAGFQTAPSVAWSATLSRWLATWVVTGPSVSGRFVDDTAKASEATFDVAKSASLVVARSSGHASMVSTSGGGELMDSLVRCP